MPSFVSVLRTSSSSHSRRGPVKRQTEDYDRRVVSKTFVVFEGSKRVVRRGWNVENHVSVQDTLRWTILSVVPLLLESLDRRKGREGNVCLKMKHFRGQSLTLWRQFVGPDSDIPTLFTSGLSTSLNRVQLCRTVSSTPVGQRTQEGVQEG